MTWITYDLETTFLQKGFRRGDTLIIEIALYGKNKKNSFQQLVNPLPKYANGEEVIASLDTLHQSPEKSIAFWVKLLMQKKLLNTSVKRKSLEEKAQALSTLFNASDLFVPTENALKDALLWGKDLAWIAHNGKSFDSKIIKGNCKRYDLPVEIDFHDSLPFFKYYLKDQVSYSQPILYKSMFKGKYMAHHALEDAKALHKMLCECVKEGDILSMFDGIQEKKKQLPKSDLLDIKGVGKKSLQIFFSKGIRSKKELKHYIAKQPIDTWMKDFKKVHAYKKLGTRLYSGELIL